MTTLNRLHVPSFDLTWLHIPAEDHVASNLVLIPGGGGSAKSGVLNQIQVGRFNLQHGFILKKSFMTDTENKSNFCSAIATGTLDGKSVVCAVMDSNCIVYQVAYLNDDIDFVKKAEFQADFESSFASVNCCTIGSKHIITGGEDKVCRLWTIVASEENTTEWTVTLIREMEGHMAPIMSLSRHPKRPWIATASKDGTCKIWDASNGQELINLPSLDGVDGSKKTSSGPAMECRGCVFSPSAKFIYSIQSGKRGPSHIVKWAIDDSAYETEAVFKVSPEDVIFASKVPLTKLRIDSTGSYIMTGASDGIVTIYDAISAKKIKSFPMHDLPVTGLAFAPRPILSLTGCKAVVVSCSADNKLGTARLFDNEMFMMILVILIFIVGAIFLGLGAYGIFFDANLALG